MAITIRKGSVFELGIHIYQNFDLYLRINMLGASSVMLGLRPSSRLFFRNNFSLLTSRTSVSHTGKLQRIMIPKKVPNLVSCGIVLQQVIPKRFFSQTPTMKSRWKPIFNEETTNRYVRLNRFQQYQQQRNDGSSLGSTTILEMCIRDSIWKA